MHSDPLNHSPDPNTPLEETLSALDQIVRQGKALYAGISSYSVDQTVEAAKILKRFGTPCLIHQPKYNMLDRRVENGLLNVLGQKGIGCIAFSPLAQGLLTDRYLKGIPPDSRAAKPHGFLKEESVPEVMPKIIRLNEIALKRGQSLAQMAISWLLRDPRITSVLIGASSVDQLENNVRSLDNTNFTSNELEEIEVVLR